MTNRFDWLVDEMKQVKTPKFYSVDGPASEGLRDAIRSADVPVPPSYIEFVLEFGNAKLYRLGTVYQVQIYAGPRAAESREGEELIHFGRTDLGLAYFKESLLRVGEETPVFEWTEADAGLRRASGGFEDWLRKKCAKARRLYKKKQWQNILDGPEPFTEQELAIVEARKEFQWRVLGVAENGDLRFEIHNGSNMLLPYLTLGVNQKNGEPFGGIWLPVGHLAPGQTGIIEKGCYKKYIDANDIEVVAEPEPGPEDRDQYWEFKTD